MQPSKWKPNNYSLYQNETPKAGGMGEGQSMSPLVRAGNLISGNNIQKN